MCTGPGTLNQHEPKVMHRIHVADYNIDKNVSPEEGAKRAAGPLIMDNLLDYIYSVDGKVEIDGRKKRLWLPGRNR